jgi:hypothetical protein
MEYKTKNSRENLIKYWLSRTINKLCPPMQTDQKGKRER